MSSFCSGNVNVSPLVNTCVETSTGLSSSISSLGFSSTGVSTSYLTSSGSKLSFCFSIFSARVFSNWSSLSKKPLRAFSLVESRFAMITCSLFASDTVPKKPDKSLERSIFTLGVNLIFSSSFFFFSLATELKNSCYSFITL